MLPDQTRRWQIEEKAAIGFFSMSSEEKRKASHAGQQEELRSDLVTHRTAQKKLLSDLMAKIF